MHILVLFNYVSEHALHMIITHIMLFICPLLVGHLVYLHFFLLQKMLLLFSMIRVNEQFLNE